MILVEADSSDEWDSKSGWADLADKAVRAAVGASRYGRLIASARLFEISVKYTDDREVRALNAAYRDKDKATNVLSFPMVDAERLDNLAAAQEGEILLGDIVLAHGICTAEAAAKGASVGEHAAHLLVHGALHLLGYDHESGEDEAATMERVEREALASLGIADPYLTEVRH